MNDFKGRHFEGEIVLWAVIARHPRSYDRHRDFEDPDHPRELLAQRRSARHQKLMQRFLALSTNAERYYQQLELRRLNARHHVHKIIALSEIYGTEPQLEES